MCVLCTQKYFFLNVSENRRGSVQLFMTNYRCDVTYVDIKHIDLNTNFLGIHLSPPVNMHFDFKEFLSIYL